MIRHEFYKVLSGKTVVFVILAGLILNVVFSWHLENERTEYDFAEYNALWDELEEGAEVSGWDEMEALLAERLSEYEGSGLSDEEQFLFMFSDDYYKYYLCSDVLSELSFQLDYAGYLDGINEAAERYERLAFFNSKDNYAYRDMMKMRRLYSAMKRLRLVPAPSAGVEMAAESGITDIIAFVMLLCLAITIWLKEREQNMLLLLRTAQNGRSRLAECKLLVMIILCIFIGIALYGSNAAVAACMYGLGDLKRPLASVYDYGHTLWEISVGGFLVLNVIFKVAAYIWMALLISVVCCRLRSTVAAFGGIIFFGAAGCLMYYKIPYLSKLSALKYLNPFAVLKTELVFADYNGLNFFEYPADYRICMMVLLSVGMVFFTFLVIYFFTDYFIRDGKMVGYVKKHVLPVVLKPFSVPGRITARHTSLVMHELYRVFVCHGIWIVTAVFMVFIFCDSRPYEVKFQSVEYYYEYRYMKMLEGTVTEEKLAWVENELAGTAGLSSEYSTAKRKALMLVKSRIAYIGNNPGACLVYDVPHRLLMACSGNAADIMQMMFDMLLLALVIPCFFTPDIQSGMFKMTGATLHGKGRLTVTRYVMGIGFGLLTGIFEHVRYFLQVIESYEVGMEIFSYPVNSLTYLAAFGSGMDIGEYYFIMYTLKILFAVFATLVIFGMSRLIKSQSYAIFAALLALVMPALAAVMYDGRLELVIYPYSLGLGNLFMQNGAAALVCMATVISAVGGMAAHHFIKSRRRHS